MVVVLGDQLDRSSAALDGFDRDEDRVWMAEVAEEATHVPSHRMRTALFLSAMRHFRDQLRGEGVDVLYRALDDPSNRGSLAAELDAALDELEPERVVWVRPGEHRVRAALREVVVAGGVDLEERRDRHFLCSIGEFGEWAEGRERFLQEHFYRWMRRRHEVLVEEGEPAGGRWNFDEENREAFGEAGPPDELAPPAGFEPDAVTREVLELVDRRFPDAPGSLEGFDWPVTPGQAEAALDAFVDERLRWFGPYQDAMWSGRPYLAHARLSAALNLKLLSPRRAIDAAVAAWEAGEVPLASAEGFVRQLLGWREYVRGIYWYFMPEYGERDALRANRPLPAFYWTGETPMACLAEVLGQTLEHAYAHHIQRLMVTGLYALLLGVRPREVHEWYLAVYADAVEWVELPNTLGMSQYADGGLLGTKPYAASGRYVDRMSDYCDDCPFEPEEAVGERACPFTTLYWDFLLRHRETLADNPRMALQLRNAERLSRERRDAIRERAGEIRERGAPPVPG